MTCERLFHILNHLTQKHSAILELERKKQTLIMKNEIELLHENINDMTKLIKEIEELEQQRAQFIREYLKNRGIQASLSLTLTEFQALVCDVEEKEALNKQQKLLMQILKDLKTQNQRNQMLIEQSLQFVDFTLQLALGGGERRTYGPSSPATSQGIYDFRA